MSDALTTHMIGDMMHDALHSDVLASTPVFSPGNQRERLRGKPGGASTSMPKHSATALRTNAARTTLDQEIKAALDGVEPALNRYIAAADTIIGLTRANGVEAQIRMPEFVEAFGGTGSPERGNFGPDRAAQGGSGHPERRYQQSGPYAGHRRHAGGADRHDPAVGGNGALDHPAPRPRRSLHPGDQRRQPGHRAGTGSR